MQAVNLAVALLKIALAGYKVEESVRLAPDAATKRAALVAGVPGVVTDLAGAFDIPATTVEQYVTPELIGILFDLEEEARALVAPAA